MAVRRATLVLAVLLRLCGGSAQPDGGDEENYGRTVSGIDGCGLLGERHEVWSRDGYLTTVFRALPRGGGGAGAEPAILQHGFLSSSDAWFQLEASSLPCVLAGAGYDVWLPNSRGNSYSKAHSTYSTEILQFWAFSFHEMAVYDLSATIDYVRSVTSAEKVSYVGHSTGGTLMLVLLSVLPEYNSRVRVGVSLAPVCFMGHTPSHLLRLLAYTAPYFEKPLNWMTNGEIPPFPDPQRPTADGDFHIGAALGEVIDFSQMLRREMALDGGSTGLLSDGTSLRTALHLAQLITRGNFSWYDFGKRNSAEYKRAAPPSYDLRRVTAPQVVLYSEADLLVVPKDAKRLCSELPEGVGVCYKVNKTGFQHSDFLSSYDAKQYVYNLLFGDLDSESGERQSKPVVPRGGAATDPEEDGPASAEVGAAEPPSEREPAVPPARGRPANFPGRGNAATSGMRSRAPISPDRHFAVAPPARGMPQTSPERERAGVSPEEEAVPKSPEWGTAETWTREEVGGKPAAASTRVAAGPSSKRGKQAAPQERTRIPPRVKGTAARGGSPGPEGGVAEGASAGAGAQERGAGSAQERGAGSAKPPRTRAAAQEEEDPSAPVKVCRYYATAGRLQRVCYEEYV